MAQPCCWGNVGMSGPSQSPGVQQCHCPPGQPQRGHSEHREHQRLPQPDLPGTVNRPLSCHLPPLHACKVGRHREGVGRWFEGWRTRTEACHIRTKVIIWFSWLFLNISSSLTALSSERETFTELGGKEGLDLDSISEAGPGLGWAGRAGPWPGGLGASWSMLFPRAPVQLG